MYFYVMMHFGVYRSYAKLEVPKYHIYANKEIFVESLPAKVKLCSVQDSVKSYYQSLLVWHLWCD